MLLVIQNQPADGHPRRVFVSYSHQDEPWKQRVMEALMPLEQQQRIAAWHDRKLLPGQDWDEEIRQALTRADVILFLVSLALIESRYCSEVEGRLAVARAEAGEAVLVPIIVRRCKFETEPVVLCRCRARWVKGIQPYYGRRVQGRKVRPLFEAVSPSLR